MWQKTPAKGEGGDSGRWPRARSAALRPCGSAPKGESLHRLGLGLLVRSHCGVYTRGGGDSEVGSCTQSDSQGPPPPAVVERPLGIARGRCA